MKKLTKALILAITAIVISGCNATQAPGAQALDATSGTNGTLSITSNDPSPDPSPSASPTPTVLSFLGTSNGSGFDPDDSFTLCQALTSWDSETTSIKISFNGYYYLVAGTGVTVTYTEGMYTGQTNEVLDPTSMSFGPADDTYCTLNISNGAVESIDNTMQGV
jgi:hypothetical protein